MSTAADLNRNDSNAATVAAVLDQTRAFVGWLEENASSIPCVWTSGGVISDLILSPRNGADIYAAIAWLTRSGGLADSGIVLDIYRALAGREVVTFDDDAYAVISNDDRITVSRSWGNCSVIVMFTREQIA